MIPVELNKASVMVKEAKLLTQQLESVAFFTIKLALTRL